jgi:diguanylate cyclase (GGDEF)-like protein
VLVRDLMTRDVVVVTPDAPLRDAVRLMRERRISCTVVCDGRTPVGLITERDLARILDDLIRQPGRVDSRVGDSMSGPVVSVCDTAVLDDAVGEIASRRIRRLPVVNAQGELVGLVTQSDLIQARARATEDQRDLLERTVRERTRELEEANRKLERLSLEDALLGIGNRRAMELALERVHAERTRYARPYSVVLIDVDHFKAYNDSYGHLQGDQVLRDVSWALRCTLRGSDAPYRYGGEEMLILLPETRLHDACRAAERVRGAIEHAGLPHRGSKSGVVTVSCGVSAPPEGGDLPAWREVVKSADDALYRAKQRGRNRVERAAPAV